MENSSINFENFKEGMNDWVIKINDELYEIRFIKATQLENIDNIQHNYELIQELKGEIGMLKEDIVMLKSILKHTIKRQIEEYKDANKQQERIKKH